MIYRLVKRGDVFPAYAGMNRRRAAPGRSGNRVPRVCGDEPAQAMDSLIDKLCSPRMRG